MCVSNSNCLAHYGLGQYQRNGFGARILEYVLSISGKEAYIDVPVSNKELLHICDMLGLVKNRINRSHGSNDEAITPKPLGTIPMVVLQHFLQQKF